jgi:formylglycine-generating enzyme required for sulfatase activity
MLPIPAGTLLMGCRPEQDPYCEADELPTREVAVAGFWLDRTEVSNGAYRRCVQAGRCEEPRENADSARFFRRDHPVTGVTWFQARTYCRWRGARLPTEAEWEWAARGAAGAIWPWGDAFACDRVCASVRPCRSYGTCPVGAHPEGSSPFGIEDLAGNVWEWVEDPYLDAAAGTSEGLRTAGELERMPKVLRGGSWRESEPYSLRASERSQGRPGQAYFNVGFRCAQTLPPRN